MKTFKILVLGLVLACTQGCAIFWNPGPAISYERVATTATDKQQLRNAIISATVRRRWGNKV